METQSLLDKDKCASSTSGSVSSKRNEIALLVILLAIKLLSTSIEYITVPLFPLQATHRGLSDTQAGIVITTHGVFKCVSSLMSEPIVSLAIPVVSLTFS